MGEDFEVFIGDRMECPFCKMKNTVITKKSHFSMHVRKHENNNWQAKNMKLVSDSELELRTYNTRIIACLDCGQISETLTPEDLENFRNDKPHFVN